MLPVKYKSYALKTRRVKSSPQAIFRKKIRPVFGNKRIPVPATDMALPEQPNLSTRLSRNRGLRKRNDPWLFQKCQLFIITKSSMLRRAWTRDRSTHAQGPPRGLRLYTSCSRSAAQCLLFCDIRDGVGGEESGRHGALTSFKLWSHTINIFSVLDFSLMAIWDLWRTFHHFK